MLLGGLALFKYDLLRSARSGGEGKDAGWNGDQAEVKTAGWATPCANEYEQDMARCMARREKIRKKRRNGNGFGPTLGMMYQLVLKDNGDGTHSFYKGDK
jgi:hypothetical protein